MKDKTILAFHIGRGGRFNNPGHLIFLGEMSVTDLSIFDDLFCRFKNEHDILKRYRNYKNIHEALQDLCTDARHGITPGHIALLKRVGLTPSDLGEIVFCDANGEPVGLTRAESETGVGCIDIDGQYDTSYTIAAENLGEEELNAIRDAYNGSQQYISQEVLELISEGE